LHIVPLHAYGAQSIDAPLGAVRVCPSIPHDAASFETQFDVAVLHVNIALQSASPLQAVPHTVPLQTNGVQATVIGVGQAPLPSQVAARVTVPFVHDVSRQEVGAPTSPVHAAVVTPSHAPALHAFAPIAAWQGGRPLRGAPATALHFPTAPGRLQASHCPVHAELQHTPSAQKPDAQSASVAQAWSRPPVHCPAALHDRAPVHESGSGPFFTAEQTPGLPARLHASHVPHDALSQHAPSTHEPVSQSAPLEQVPPRKCRSHVTPTASLTKPPNITT
jgi:hypothetical protein